jgi:TatD DNase family protein
MSMTYDEFMAMKNKKPISTKPNEYKVDMKDTSFMIDIGSNLTCKQFNKIVPDVIDRAFQHDVKMQIVTGTDFKNVYQAKELCNQDKYKQTLKYTVGMHPHNAKNFSKHTYTKFRELLSSGDSQIVAVGETGLDYFRMLSPASKQIDSFKQHIDLAIEFKKPLFLHSRDAHEDFITVLDSYGDKLPPVVVHCFTGTESELKDYISRGYYVGITGFIAIEKRSQELQKFVNIIPLDKLMIETDAPYMKPTGSPKTPSGCMEPYLLNLVAKKLAGLYRVKPEVIIKYTNQNTKKFFNLV